jgi:hypothetical protein
LSAPPTAYLQKSGTQTGLPLRGDLKTLTGKQNFDNAKIPVMRYSNGLASELKKQIARGTL